MRASLSRAARAVSAFVEDARTVVDTCRSRGASSPRLRAAAEPALWVLALVRGGAAVRALGGSSFASSLVLRTIFHVDVWTDDIGPGLRLPHPFGIVIGEGVSIGARCTLMHNVTVQRSPSTRIGDGVTLATGAVVLEGSSIGDGAVVGAASVVRGMIPAGSVAVGAPARVVRPAA